MSEVRIGDVGGIEFSNVVRDSKSQDPWSVDVLLYDDGLSARHKVWSHYASGFTDLVLFFAGLAAEWRGWPGDRTYESLEGELVLTARHRASRVQVVAVLAQTAVEDGWRATATFTLDAGEQLVAAARDLEGLLGSN